MLTEKTFDTGTVTINYAEGPPGGKPFIMLHGGTLRWQTFLPVIPSFAFRYHIYALDLRGHGLSSHITGAYRIEDYAEDIVRFLRAHGTEPAVLVGHSLGAHIAVQVAVVAPHIARAIVLEETSLYLITDGRFPGHPIYQRLQGLHEILSTDPAMDDIISTMERLLPKGDLVSRRSWAKSLSQVDPDALASILDNRAFEHFHPNELLAKVSCPVLLLQGNPALDGVMEDQDVERILAHVDHCTHVSFPELGHGIHSMQPNTFFQIVSNFLEAL